MKQVDKRWKAICGFLITACASVALADQGSPAVDAEADAKLRAMSDYLAGLQAFRVDVDTDTEVVDLSGQKLQYSSSMKVVMQRPDRLLVERQSPFAEGQIGFDGEVLTVSILDPAVYSQFDVSGDIEAAVRTLRYELGLDAPAGDLFFADPYTGLVTDLVSGQYLGTAFIDGSESHHLAFRAKQVDWQIWVQVGDEPLPLKYVITSKWVAAAPQFSARFQDWDTNPGLVDADFKHTLPEGATRVDQLPINALGEPMPVGDSDEN